MKNLIDLTGKKILVTGASSGIGRATAILCSQLGASVVLVARDEQRTKQTLAAMEPGQHMVLLADLNDLDAIGELVPRMVEDGVKLDGFVHAAGITLISNLRDDSYQNVDRLIRINFYAYLEILKRIYARKYSNDGMSVVGLSSMAVSNGRGTAAYAATKAAMETFTRVSQPRLVKRRIRVNMIRPSFVRTPMGAEFFDQTSDEELDKRYPLGAIEPEDVANTICFFLSDASNKITDQVIHIDAGSPFR